MILMRISIITPSFNQGDYIEETIQSVLSQKYGDLQYIIVDGGSIDNSVSIIKKYEKYLSYWISAKDDGQTNAINKGLNIADGEIISWLCSDDLYVENALTGVADYFNDHPDISFLHGKTILFGGGKGEQIKGAQA